MSNAPAPASTSANNLAATQAGGRATSTSNRNSRKGAGGKWKQWVFWGILILVGVPASLNWAKSWWESQKNEAEKSAVSKGQNQSTQRALPSWHGVEHEFALSTEKWTDPIRVNGDRCIRFWTSNPEANGAEVQVRGVNHATWYDWAEFQTRRKAGTLPYTNFGWMRFKAMGVPVVMHTTFLLPGQCD